MQGKIHLVEFLWYRLKEYAKETRRFLELEIGVAFWLLKDSIESKLRGKGGRSK